MPHALLAGYLSCLKKYSRARSSELFPPIPTELRIANNFPSGKPSSVSSGTVSLFCRPDDYSLGSACDFLRLVSGHSYSLGCRGVTWLLFGLCFWQMAVYLCCAQEMWETMCRAL